MTPNELNAQVYTLANTLSWVWHVGILVVLTGGLATLVAVAGTLLSRVWPDYDDDETLAMDLRTPGASVPPAARRRAHTARVLALRATHDRLDDRSRVPIYKVGSDLTTREERLKGKQAR